MHHPIDGSTMKDRSDDPSHHERTLLPRSYSSDELRLQKGSYAVLRLNALGFTGYILTCIHLSLFDIL